MNVILAMFSSLPAYVLWPYIAGSALALIGLLATREDAAGAQGWDKILALGPLFFAAPLAAFGAEHFAIAQFIQGMIPSWIPGHLFWAYFVGFALIAAALSIATKIQGQWSGTMLGIMFFLFVLTLHIPRVAANPRDRISWAVALRDLAFAGGAWAFAGSQSEAWRDGGTSTLVTLGRFMIAIPAVFFGVEHFLHPAFLPGVPLEKLTPVWIPGRVFVGYLTGAVLLAAGTSLVLGIKKRTAASCLGIFILALVLFIYLPMVIAIPSAADGGQKIEGLNYFFDTLLFGGAVVALANAMPKDSPVG